MTEFTAEIIEIKAKKLAELLFDKYLKIQETKFKTQTGKEDSWQFNMWKVNLLAELQKDINEYLNNDKKTP